MVAFSLLYVCPLTNQAQPKAQDAINGRYFADFDLHGEEMPYLLKIIAVQERTMRNDLSDRVIPIDPSDPDFSVGMNPLRFHDQLFF